MALVIKSLYNYYDYHFNEVVDERIKDLFLISSPWPIFAITAVYIFFVTGRGQQWMKEREPFELNRVINVYNVIQIFLNLYLCVGITRMFFGNLNPYCIPPANKIPGDYGREVTYYSHMYYLVKIVDLLDTVFFILRKKNNQVTFLHVYHHGCLVVACYFYIKFLAGGGQPILLGAINSFVHVVMYSYYFLTSYKPELKKSLWFKRHITELQMLQFLILFFHLMIPVLTSCESFPKGLSAALAFQNVFMFILFGDFYYKAYIRKR